MRVLGIDEAGRGCVFGDLVIGGFFQEVLDDELLKASGAADSKKLSHKRRIAARAKLADAGQPDVRTVTPAQIDSGNLNTLEEDVIVDLVQTWKPDTVIIDALGHPSTIGKTIERLKARVGPGGPSTWIMEPKADHTYPIVGAASIFAKTTRDQLLAEHAETYGIIGSGYPSDPKVRSWLTEWSKTGEPWPSFVRTRWETVRLCSQQSLA